MSYTLEDEKARAVIQAQREWGRRANIRQMASQDGADLSYGLKQARSYANASTLANDETTSYLPLMIVGAMCLFNGNNDAHDGRNDDADPDSFDAGTDNDKADGNPDDPADMNADEQNFEQDTSDNAIDDFQDNFEQDQSDFDQTDYSQDASNSASSYDM